MVEGDKQRFEMGIRAWASNNEQARRTVEHIDKRRIAYMASLASEAGLPEKHALARSRVGYLAWLGSYSGALPTDVDERLSDMDCLWGMLLL